MFRRRLVRLHLEDRIGGGAPSMEGILVGWPRHHAGHYVLANARLITAPDQSTGLDGRQYVPRERVVFCQEVSR